MHITTKVPEGGSAVQTGLRATKYGWTPIDQPYWTEAEAGFFEA